MNPSFASRALPHAGWIAALLFVAAVAAFGTALDGYSHASHPVALLGAGDVPHALAFNLAAFVLPGLLAACVASALHRRLPPRAGWSARIGARLALWSALAFAMQGLLPLDPTDLAAPANRAQAAAWTLWWIAFVPSGVLLAAGLFRVGGWRWFALASLAAGVLVLAFAVVAPVGAGLAQRLAFGAWFAWWVVAARVGR